MVWAKIKWVFATIVALGVSILAFVYGKNTGAVYRARVREKEAKLRRVKLELKDAELRAQRATDEEEAKQYQKKADTLSLRLVDIREAATKITGDIKSDISDKDYADNFNQRASERSSSTG